MEGSNDEHRGADQESGGGASGAAGDGTGALLPGLAVTWKSSTIYLAGGGAGYTIAPAGRTAAYTSLIGVGVPVEFILEPPKSLEDGGIVVGEIVGWRGWRVVDGKLHSMFIGPAIMLTAASPPGGWRYIWEPGRPMDGDVTDHGSAGVYAYKTRAKMAEEMPYVVNYGNITEPMLYGEVSLWGNVVEHEHGYRAQYAKPKRLYHGPGFPRGLYEQVCATYGLEPVEQPVIRRLRPGRSVVPVLCFAVEFFLAAISALGGLGCLLYAPGPVKIASLLWFAASAAALSCGYWITRTWWRGEI